MYRLFRVQFLALLVAVVLFSTYAFASDESGFSPSGEGANAISGWIVSNVQYRLTDDPSKISAVEFDLDGSANRVSVSLDSSGVKYFQCENSVGTHWICAVNSQVRVSDINELRVVAVGQ